MAKGLQAGVLIQFEDQFFKLFLSAYENGIGQLNATVEPPSIESGIPAQGEHLLLQEIGGSWIDSLYLEVEMKGFSFHQLHASSIHPNLFHLMDGLTGMGNVKAPYQVHRTILDAGLGIW
jgi:hypothetical protein